jgi:hypothetical protein
MCVLSAVLIALVCWLRVSGQTIWHRLQGFRALGRPRSLSYPSQEARIPINRFEGAD